MEKRYKLIEISKFYCKNQEVHTTEYHDGYIDYDILCKINNKVCDEEHCNHKQLQLDGFTEEEMIEKMAKAFFPWDFFPHEIEQGKGWNDLNEWQKDKYLAQAKAALKALLEDK